MQGTSVKPITPHKPVGAAEDSAASRPADAGNFARAYEAAPLEDPFDGPAAVPGEFHTSQHAPLNAQLRGAVEKHLKERQGVIDNALTSAQTALDTLRRSGAEVEVGLDAHKEGFHATEVKVPDTDALIEELKLKLAASRVEMLNAIPPLDNTAVTMGLEELQGRFEIPQARLPMKRSQLDPTGARADREQPGALGDTVVGLHVRAHQDILAPVRNELSKNDVPLAKLRRDATLLREQRVAAIKAKTLDAAQQLMEREVTALQEVAIASASRLSMVDQAFPDLSTFRDTAGVLGKRCREISNAFCDRENRTAKEAAEDREALESSAASRLEAHLAAKAAFEAEQEKRHERLKEMLSEERTAWEAAMESLARAAEVGKKRAALTLEICGACEVEDARQQRYMLKNELLVKHTAGLRACEAGARAAAVVGQHFVKYADAMAGRVQGRDLESQLDTLFDDEGMQFAKDYKVFLKAAEDLRARTQTRATLHEQRSRELALNAAAALEAYDPNAAEYKTTAAAADQTADEAKKSLSSLQAIVDECDAVAAPWLIRLAERGAQYSPSTDEEEHSSDGVMRRESTDMSEPQTPGSPPAFARAPTEQPSMIMPKKPIAGVKKRAVDRGLRPQEAHVNRSRDRLHAEQSAVEDTLTALRRRRKEVAEERVALEQRRASIAASAPE